MSKSDKRDEIMGAALELIVEHGFHGAPMAMIAERAGVGAGTIYRYFENKDIMIHELYRDLEERIYPVLLEGYTREMPFRGQFVHLGTALLRYFIDNPLDFSYLEQFHHSPYGAAFRRERLLGNREGCSVFLELFERGMTQQVIKDLPLAIITALFFGPLLTVARDHNLGFIALDNALIGRTIEACWDAVKR
jgi:AcrR family transcriptional regulator